MTDREANRFSARAARYARVGTNVGGVAAKFAASRLFGFGLDRGKNATALAAALGGLKGPIMKVAQLMATIPDLLPPEYVEELQKLQSDAPPMGWAFVKRRMMAELGAGWQDKFAEFEHKPAAAASLGQVHRARSLDGEPLAAKLQYPDMQSAVEADLQQLDWLFAIHRRMDPVDRHERDRQGDRRARARGARLPARGEARRALSRDAQGHRSHPRAGRVAGAIDRPAAHARLARRHQAARAQEGAARTAQSHWPGDVHRVVVSVQPLRRDPRRSASRQLHGVRAKAARPAASTCSTTAASASSRRNSSAAWSISTTGCCATTAIWWCMPTRPGASRPCRARRSTSSTSGPSSSTGRCWRIASAPSRMV